MIDIHAHMGNLNREGYPAYPPMTVHQLINRMDKDGINISVLLPLESPEGNWGYFLNEEAVEARNLYPERLIAFCCADPRYPKAAELIDLFVKHHGCRGVGELVMGLPLDDERCKKIYKKCDELGLPLIFEIAAHLKNDEPDLAHLENCLKEFPNINFLGHGGGFWEAISRIDAFSGGYPSGKIIPGGAISRLLDKYDNLHLDLSAGSGFNAMTRDPDFSKNFIQQYWQRMLWGSDIVYINQDIPQLEWIKQLNISIEIVTAITDTNARKLLNL